MDEETELRIVKRKFEEHHLDPEKCVWQDSCELDLPASLSGRYLHLSGLRTEFFQQKVVVSVSLHNARVLYAFCKNFLTPASLRTEVLALILQINARLTDAVFIYKPTKRQSLYLKQTVYVSSQVNEAAFGALFWKEMVRVTEIFQRELADLACYLARFEVPSAMEVKRDVPELVSDQVRRLMPRRGLESKARDEMLPDKLPDSVAVYSAEEYCSRCALGAVQLALTAFSLYVQLTKKGIEPRPANLASFVFTPQLPKKTAFLACSDFNQIVSRDTKPDELSSFLDLQERVLTPAEVFHVLALCPIVFLRDLIVTPDMMCSTLSRERCQYRLQPLFAMNASLKYIAIDYYIQSKVCPKLESSQSLHDGIAIFPLCSSLDSWGKLSLETQLTLQAQVWHLQDSAFVPLAVLSDSTKRSELLQRILPKLVLELGRMHVEGLAHFQLTPGRVWVDQRNWEVQVTEACGLKERFNTENVRAEDRSFLAPELLANEAACGSHVDVYSLAMTVHAFLFPSEVLRYSSATEQLQQVRRELRRPYIPNDFESENPEFVDVLRRSWEDRFRPSLTEFVWSHRRPR